LTQEEHGPMDRTKVTEIVCKDCHTRQSCSNRCVNPSCGVTEFAEYHCDKCNLWMGLEKKPFHCEECGICRVGGREQYRHCDVCSMCIHIDTFETHICLKDKYKNQCPVCREDMHTSRHAPQDLPCGHAIHAHCFRKLAGFDYRCPVCKKTVVSQRSMAAAWAARAVDIQSQPMPSDLARVVNIMCYDCEEKSQNLPWHFLGVQCPQCMSFNTVVEDIVNH
jgi:RING finger/CHY zinc finger protein 1